MANNQLQLFTQEDPYLANLDKRIAIYELGLKKQDELNLLYNELGKLNDYYGSRQFCPENQNNYKKDKAILLAKMQPLAKEIDSLMFQFKEACNELTSIK